ncbi:ABC transporter substrate-binding protein [Patulibacter brassicae]|uniref:ABC transporter substrate-binding protein n=1 Tax=Patulibacter brassicae TaxID=1705717 RepID=A0ABU4VLQ5_9ACTN|nr:ABC transporter substrate-binding protein [Patulibacter brassicae]MDX8151715.1 ABC transporter substrate-binding protein [Patulibacter brassicae]
MSTSRPRALGETRPRWSSTAAAAVLALLTLALLLPATASAHPSLVQSAPLGGLSSERPPAAVRLAFTEKVIARGSSIEVRGPRGARIASGRPRLEKGTVLSAPLPAGLRSAVYDVRWVALGADGHTTSGSFRFGVSGKNGAPPPGAERLAGGSSTGLGARGSEDVQNEGWFELAVRWLGLLGAATLLGGVLLRRRTRRLDRSAADRDREHRRWQRIAVVALALSLFGAAEAVAVLATAGVGDPSFALLTGNGNGRVALLRLVLTAALGAAALVARSRSGRVGGTDRSDVLLGLAGAASLAAYGLDGHVQGLDGGVLVAAVVGAAHGLAAGVWAGGLLALLLLGGGRPAIRAYAPLAIGAVAVLSVSGVVAALRELDGWYALRWSDYGRILAVKVLLALATVALGWRVTRKLRADAPDAASDAPRRILRVEALGAVAILALAAVIAGLVPGRGQPTAAQQGNILGGPALATFATGGALARVTVAPAEPGANVLAVLPATLKEGTAARAPKRITARLRCACAKGEIRATLTRGAGGTWSAPVRLPASGAWFAYLTVGDEDEATPVALAIGDVRDGGPAPRTVVQTADLSGAGNRTCRAHAQGASLAIGRLNARGGIDGHRKVVLRTVDDGGSPERAAEIVREARDDGAIALLSPCGAGSGGALRAAGDLPAVVGEPGTPIVEGKRIFRTAGDPRSEGIGMAKFVAEQGPTSRPGAPLVITYVAPARPTAASRARLAGLQEGVRGSRIRVRVLPGSTVADQDDLARAIDARNQLVSVLDGDAADLAPALRRLGDDRPQFANNLIVAPSTLLDERFIVDSGSLGREGAIAPFSEVQLGSRDAEAYANIVGLLLPGERPSIAGLRGYVAGLALTEGLADGSDAGDVEARLRRPKRFTDALVVPWRADARSAGAPLFQLVQATFLPQNLIPQQAGGSSFAGRFFVDGAWSPLQGRSYGPQIQGFESSPAPAPPVSPGQQYPTG